MFLLQLFFDYWRWHYGTAIANILSIWSDFFWFLRSYFSTGRFAGTFFVPWRNIHEDSAGISEFFKLISSVVTAFSMRIIGTTIRLIIMVLGLVSKILLATLGVLFLILWIVMPVALAITFAVGVNLLIKDLPIL
ncbi:MAG: hypothetical protein Q7S19_03090 [bacterium]|nr:hypothetical protein [bacterium]